MFQVVLQDEWGRTFTVILKSHSAALTLALLFMLPIMLSMIINGFVIANYLCEIERKFDAEVVQDHPVGPQQKLQEHPRLQERTF
jgi:hypothetical protein